MSKMSSREIYDSMDGIDSRKEYKFRDPVVRHVCDMFVQRSDEGFKKYGRTLSDEMLGGHKHLDGYLNDVQEELMDAILYLQTARELIDEIVGPFKNS